MTIHKVGNTDLTQAAIDTSRQADGILSNVTDTLSSLTMKDDEVMDAAGVQAAVGTTVLLTSALSSVFTRSRVASGSAPILRYWG